MHSLSWRVTSKPDSLDPNPTASIPKTTRSRKDAWDRWFGKLLSTPAWVRIAATVCSQLPPKGLGILEDMPKASSSKPLQQGAVACLQQSPFVLLGS